MMVSVGQARCAEPCIGRKSLPMNRRIHAENRRSPFLILQKILTGLLAAAALLGLTGGMSHAQAKRPPHWVGAWATAPMGPENAWSRQPFCDVTEREVAHLSVGGRRFRVRLTNEFGVGPLTIGAAHIALRAQGSAIQPGTDRALTFGGQPSVTIPAGSMMMSDPVELDAPAFADVAVSLYIPSQYVQNLTFHDFANHTNYTAKGNVVDSAQLTDATETASWYFFDGIDAVGTANSRAIVALGDSITDGAHSTADANRSWPDDLAQRLSQQKTTANISVLNEGIGGNRVLNDGYGPSDLSRFDRDVLGQSGVKYLILLEGINDIGRLAHLRDPADNITAGQLETAMRQMVERAHGAGILVYGATLTPYGGAGYYSDKGEQVREAVNAWIRSSGVFDGVVDFDKATQDPQNPTRFLPAYDSGDHLHPSDAGYKAMADAIDLSLFR